MRRHRHSSQEGCKGNHRALSNHWQHCSILLDSYTHSSMKSRGWRSGLTLGICVAAIASAQPAPESPLGLVLTSSDTRLVRAGFQLDLHARAGDVLFAGDSLEAVDGSVT